MGLLSLEEQKELLKKAYENRVKILEIINRCGSVHLGGCFSVMDILTVLYNKVLKHDPLEPKWKDRDIFLLSAGHKAVSLYVVLQSLGYFEEDLLWTFSTLHSKLPMHPDDKKLNCIEFPTGSLGHGLPVGCGIAAAFKQDKKKNRVFVLLGDGECEEGCIWEAALVAKKYKLDNLIVIIDANGLQSEACYEEILPIAPLDEKFKSFGWSVRSINGHNISEIFQSLIEAPYELNKPTCIVANTVKAKGLNFAENIVDFHHWCPSDKSHIEEAKKILNAAFETEMKGIS
ncbi:MAG: transketolase [Candidatus Humimicrobiaceae bacterium]